MWKPVFAFATDLTRDRLLRAQFHAVQSTAHSQVNHLNSNHILSAMPAILVAGSYGNGYRFAVRSNLTDRPAEEEVRTHERMHACVSLF
jgi:hypothetical protein